MALVPHPQIIDDAGADAVLAAAEAPRAASTATAS